MNRSHLYIITALCLFINCQNKSSIEIQPEIVNEDYFGHHLADAFRYLENDTFPEITMWYEANNAHAKNKIDNIPGRQKIYESILRIENLRQIEITKVKKSKGSNYFYLKKLPQESAAKLYVGNVLEGSEILIYDPEQENPEDDGIIINYISPNAQGNKIAFSITRNDAEVSEIKIYDLIENKLLPETITHCAPAVLLGINWLKDGSGFSYMHIPDIDPSSEKYFLNTECVLYKIGDNPKDFTTLFSSKKYPSFNISEDSYPIMEFDQEYAFTGIFNVSPFVDYYYQDYLSTISGKSDWKPLYSQRDKINHFYVKGNKIVFTTAKDAPNFRICEAPIGNLSNLNWKTVVKEDKESVITDLAVTKQGIYFVKTKNGTESRLFKIENDESVEEIAMPHKGVANISSYDSKSDHLFLGIEGWTLQYTLFELDPDSKKFKKSPFSTAMEYEDLKDVVIKEIEVPSHDGEMVPLSIVHAKDFAKNSENRVLMEGYGAYGISKKPYLNAVILHWINNGGIYALAHVRGGGEKGDKWHQGGYKLTKPNSWKDFIACAEYLVSSGYTKPNKLAIFGGSAGGITIGRALTERPELFGAAIIRSGILNTTRTEFGIGGKGNVNEFGTVKDSLEFLSLLEMDAYHHIEEGKKYPALYASVGLNDSRVSPWETAKFIAKLRMANKSDKAILFSVDKEAGHGFNLTPKKKYNAWANLLTFALWQTGHPDFQPE